MTEALNFENTCRACLKEGEAMLSLFEVYEHDLTLAMILESCIRKTVGRLAQLSRIF